MSRLKLKKLKEDAEFNDQMRIERNSYLIEKQILKGENEELEKKYETLELEMEQLKQDFYFDMRNKQMEIEVLKNQLKESKGIK